MRRGRLKVVSDGHFDSTRVFVIPEDGSEPIFLPVSNISVRVQAGGAFEVDLTAYACEVDVVEDTVFGKRRIRAKSSDGMVPVVYPDLELTPPNSWTQAVRWAVSYAEPLATIFTRALPEELRRGS